MLYLYIMLSNYSHKFVNFIYKIIWNAIKRLWQVHEKFFSNEIIVNTFSFQSSLLTSWTAKDVYRRFQALISLYNF